LDQQKMAAHSARFAKDPMNRSEYPNSESMDGLVLNAAGNEQRPLTVMNARRVDG
jgi:hypothetical protein